MDFTLTENDDHPEFFRLDKERLAAVDCHQLAIAALLNELGYDGALLTLPENFSWFTAGGDSRFQSLDGNSPVAIFVTHTGRVILTHDAVSPQLFDTEIAALGFQLKEWNWRESVEDLYDEITRGRSVISDSGAGRTRNLSSRIASLRTTFSPYIEEKWQQLAGIATYAVEATCRNMKPNTTEAEVAGEVSHRLLKREIIPVEIQVLADDRVRRYRHWSYSQSLIKKRCTVNLIARKNGVHFAVSRTVSFQPLTPKEQEEYQQAGEILAQVLSCVKADANFQQVWQELVSLYKKKKLPNQWRAAEFAWQLGYRHPEQIFKPDESRHFANRTPWCWQSVVGSTMIGLSLLVNKTTPQCCNSGDRWAMREFQSHGHVPFLFPEILERFLG